MLKHISAIVTVFILILGFASTSQAATPRSTWVENEIYQYNHPFASQLPQELAMKMQKMTASPFAFYRGTAHIFYRDMQTLPGSGFVNSFTSAIYLEGDMHMQNLGAMSSYIASIPSSKRYSNSYYTLKDIRLKLGSGTGSLGKYRYYLLIVGPSSATDDDRILEMKQEGSSAVAIAVPGLLPSSIYGNHEGARVTIATKAMLSNTDPLVGYTTVSSIPFMLHEKSPYQVDFDYTLLTTKSKFMDAMGYSGKVVAKNHAISDKDYDAAIIAVSVDKEVTDITNGNKAVFKDEIVNFALDYVTQVEYDYASFKDAYNRGMTLY